MSQAQLGSLKPELKSCTSRLANTSACSLSHLQYSPSHTPCPTAWVFLFLKDITPCSSGASALAVCASSAVLEQPHGSLPHRPQASATNSPLTHLTRCRFPCLPSFPSLENHRDSMTAVLPGPEQNPRHVNHAANAVALTSYSKILLTWLPLL